MEGQNDRFVLLGTVVRAHGVCGEVTVRVDDPSLAREFQKQETLWIENGSSPRIQRKIESARAMAKGISIRLEGVCSRDEAELLRGARLFQKRSLLSTVGKDEYLTGDLVGLEVRTTDGDVLGRVSSVEEAGEVANLIVRGEAEDSEEEDLQIPLAETFIHEISLEGGFISVTKPEEFPLSESEPADAT